MSIHAVEVRPEYPERSRCRPPPRVFLLPCPLVGRYRAQFFFPPCPIPKPRISGSRRSIGLPGTTRNLFENKAPNSRAASVRDRFVFLSHAVANLDARPSVSSLPSRVWSCLIDPLDQARSLAHQVPSFVLGSREIPMALPNQLSRSKWVSYTRESFPCCRSSNRSDPPRQETVGMRSGGKRQSGL
jgi:hypothetical protein